MLDYIFNNHASRFDVLWAMFSYAAYVKGVYPWWVWMLVMLVGVVISVIGGHLS